MWSSMKIGALAKAVGCHVETVRYYEKAGLLPPVPRAANGYSEFSDVHLQLLRLIRHAKELGFSRPQVRELVQLARTEGSACDDVHQITLAQLDVVAEKLRGLRRLQSALKKLSIACEKNMLADCPVLEQLVGN